LIDLPAGEHELRYWHAALGDNASWVSKPVAVAAAGARVVLAVPLAAR
jgi:hypothetical protein